MISHSKKPDWVTLCLLAGMYALLLGNVWMYAFHRLLLPVHILISAAGVHLAFTIWHEAAHGNVLRSKWGNYLIGIFGIFPYMTPFFIQRHIHLLHHAKLNQPDDPNLIYADGPFWQIPFRYFRAASFVKKLLRKDPRKTYEVWIDAASVAAVAAVYVLNWHHGHLWDAVILWAVPVMIAKMIMDWYVNFLPHAGLPPHKFRGTRIVDVPWLTPLLLFHNYHAVHHLWPQFSWRNYFQVFRERKEFLIQNGVPVESKIPDIRFDRGPQAV